MDARALGFDFDFRDGLSVDGLAPAGEGEATLVTVDPEPVAAARRRRPPEPERPLRIGPGPDGWVLDAPGVGAALVSTDGLRVRCAPRAGSPDWPALLAQQVLPLVATLRGHEVFHASGVVVGGRAHLLCAARGVGKTSLATQLVLRGAELLSDDIVAVDDSLRAHPGPGILHVRAPELANVDVAAPAAGHLRWMDPVRGRGRLAVDTAGTARPLGGVYLLGRYRDGPPVVTLPSPGPVQLLGATFNLSVRTPERLVRQLALCARLAAEVRVAQVRILAGQSAPQLADELLTDMTAAGPA